MSEPKTMLSNLTKSTAGLVLDPGLTLASRSGNQAQSSASGFLSVPCGLLMSPYPVCPSPRHCGHLSRNSLGCSQCCVQLAHPHPCTVASVPPPRDFSILPHHLSQGRGVLVPPQRQPKALQFPFNLFSSGQSANLYLYPMHLHPSLESLVTGQEGSCCFTQCFLYLHYSP